MEEFERLKKNTTTIKWINILLLIIIVGFLIFDCLLILNNSDNSPDLQKAYMESVFNSQFTGFEGDSVKAITVRVLIDKVLNNNSENEHKIKINGSSAIFFKDEIKNDSEYIVKLEYENNGYINNIIIKEINDFNNTNINNLEDI